MLKKVRYLMMMRREAAKMAMGINYSMRCVRQGLDLVPKSIKKTTNLVSMRLRVDYSLMKMMMKRKTWEKTRKMTEKREVTWKMKMRTMPVIITSDFTL